MKIRFNQERLKYARLFSLVFALLAIFISCYFIFVNYQLVYALAGLVFLIMLVTAFMKSSKRLKDLPVIFELHDQQLLYHYGNHTGDHNGTVCVDFSDIKSIWIDGESLFDHETIRRERATLALNTEEAGYFDDLPKADEYAVDNHGTTLTISLFDVSAEDKDQLLRYLQEAFSIKNRRKRR